MTVLPIIEEDVVYEDESVFEEEAKARKRRNLKLLVAVTIYCEESKRRRKRTKKQRRGDNERTRKDPVSILQEGINDGLLRNEYRMSKESLLKLASLLESSLLPSARNYRKDVLLPLEKVMMSLRYFAGSRYVDICRIHGVSKPAVFRSIRQVVRAINSHPLVGKPKWPTNEEECDVYAQEWASMSGPSPEARGLLDHCVGAIDGILIRTRAPTRRETTRVRDFFSGHKKTVGLNVQVVCDAKLRIMFVSAAPGKTNDWRAYSNAKVSTLIESLPPGFYVLGDNAYMCSDHMLVPFPGRLGTGDPKDTFNFYLSQLRVRVENCFARLVGTWGIFWKPLRNPLRYQPQLIKAVCCLHNFCIDEKESFCFDDAAGSGVARVDADGRLVDPMWRTNYHFNRPTVSTGVRDDLTAYIRSKNLSRPDDNLRRRRNSL